MKHILLALLITYVRFDENSRSKMIWQILAYANAEITSSEKQAQTLKLADSPNRSVLDNNWQHTIVKRNQPGPNHHHSHQRTDRYLFASSATNQTSPCKEYDDEYLEDLLIKQSKISKVREYSKIWSHDSEMLKSLANSPLVENSQCKTTRRIIRRTNERSICPWRYVLSDYREDRFPRYKMEAKCTCSKCTLLNDQQLQPTYGCMPIVKIVPVLVVQDECGTDGYRNWTFASEELSVACICGIINDMVLP